MSGLHVPHHCPLLLLLRLPLLLLLPTLQQDLIPLHVSPSTAGEEEGTEAVAAAAVGG